MAFSVFISVLGKFKRNSVVTRFPTQLGLLLSTALFSISLSANFIAPVAGTCEVSTPSWRDEYADHVACMGQKRNELLRLFRNKNSRGKRWTDEDESKLTALYGDFNACVFQAIEKAAQDPSLCFRPEDAIVAFDTIGRLRGENIVGFHLYEKLELTADGSGTLRVPHLLVTMLVPFPDASAPTGLKYVTLTFSIPLTDMVEDSGNPRSLVGQNYNYQGSTNGGANSNAPFSVGLNRHVVPLMEHMIEHYSNGRRSAYDVVSTSLHLDVTRDDQWRAKHLAPGKELHQFQWKLLNQNRLSWDQRSECLSTDNIMVFSGTYGAPGVRPNGLPELDAMASARVIAQNLQSSATMDSHAQTLQGMAQMPITGLANAGLNFQEQPTAENGLAVGLHAAYNIALVGPGVSQGGAELGALGLATLNAGMIGNVVYESLIKGNDVNTLPLLLQSLNLLLVAASLPPPSPQSEVWTNAFRRLNTDLSAACNQCTQVGTQNAVNRAFLRFSLATGWKANMGAPVPYDGETLAAYQANLNILTQRLPILPVSNLPAANVQPAIVPVLNAP